MDDKKQNGPFVRLDESFKDLGKVSRPTSQPLKNRDFEKVKSSMTTLSQIRPTRDGKESSGGSSGGKK